MIDSLIKQQVDSLFVFCNHYNRFSDSLLLKSSGLKGGWWFTYNPTSGVTGINIKISSDMKSDKVVQVLKTNRHQLLISHTVIIYLLYIWQQMSSHLKGMLCNHWNFCQMVWDMIEFHHKIEATNLDWIFWEEPSLNNIAARKPYAYAETGFNTQFWLQWQWLMDWQ